MVNKVHAAGVPVPRRLSQGVLATTGKREIIIEELDLGRNAPNNRKEKGKNQRGDSGAF